jgi:hypothetical protein
MAKVKIGLLKDILWWLRGYLERDNNSFIKNEHIESLKDIIEKLED